MTVVVVALYVVVAMWLSLYGFNLVALSVVYLFHRQHSPSESG